MNGSLPTSNIWRSVPVSPCPPTSTKPPAKDRNIEHTDQAGLDGRGRGGFFGSVADVGQVGVRESFERAFSCLGENFSVPPKTMLVTAAWICPGWTRPALRGPSLNCPGGRG